MVISSILTIQLENIHAPIPLNRSRTRSVPTYTSEKSPDRSHKKRKSRRHRQKFIPDKPTFINFASPYIDPYRCLTPVIIDHNHRRRFKSSKRPKQKQELPDDSIISEKTKIEENFSSTQVTLNNDPIDLWPSDTNCFDMEFIRKRQMAIDNIFYRETINTWKPSSFQHLITLIEQLTTGKNSIDRVWVIYYWISQNILYDTDSLNQQQSEEIFRLGKTTADGYATIFKTLCDHIGIKCLKITGYAKDSNFRINQPIFRHTNHTWNAVELDDNHWYLIDLTWGSGYIKNNQKYKKDLQIHYFLTRPECMIYNHLPENSRWQLLAKPISMIDYIRLPYLHSYYFIYDLTIISPRFSSMIVFDTKQSFPEVLIQAPDDVQLTCSIKDDNKSTTLTQYDASRQLWQCLIALCQSGFRTLIIYANRLSTSTVLTNVIELSIEIPSKDFIRGQKLPITYGKFIEHKCQIFSPLDGILKRGSKVIIHCRIPNASSARISTDDIWLDEVILKNNVLKQKVQVPEREIIIYAQFANKKLNNVYDGLIRYIVE